MGTAGRPKGALNKTTLAARALLDREAEQITRKCVEMAKAGCPTALRLCLDRLLPPRREERVEVDLPEVTDATSGVEALQKLIKATTEGQVTPGEALAVANLLAQHLRAVELVALEERLDRVEQSVAERGAT